MRKEVFKKGMILAMVCLFLGAGSVQKVISDNSIFRDTIIVPDGCSTIKETIYQTQISSGIFIGINGENDEELDDFVINYNDGGNEILYISTTKIVEMLNISDLSIQSNGFITLENEIDASDNTNNNDLYLGAGTINLEDKIILASENANLHGIGRIQTINIASNSLIQNGIDLAIPENTKIYISEGEYLERILVEKSSIDIIGNVSSPFKTIINGEEDSNVITLRNVRNINIEGLSIINSGDLGDDSGIYMDKTDETDIQHNLFINCNNGINLNQDCSSNNIISNQVKNCYLGIYIGYFCKDNDIKNNFINESGETYNNEGRGYSIYLDHSEETEVFKNVINTSKHFGIYLEGSRENTINENIIENCDHQGLVIADESNINQIKGNTFTNNGGKADQTTDINGFDLFIHQSRKNKINLNGFIDGEQLYSVSYWSDDEDTGKENQIWENWWGYKTPFKIIYGQYGEEDEKKLSFKIDKYPLSSFQ